jgi:hypothetical protein
MFCGVFKGLLWPPPNRLLKTKTGPIASEKTGDQAINRQLVGKLLAETLPTDASCL